VETRVVAEGDETVVVVAENPKPGAPEKRVDVALAEFNALRAEILSYTTAQAALIGVGLTALAVIVGFVVKEGGDDRLLLAIPPLALVINLLQAANTYRMATIGRYIQESLWPYLQREVGDEDLPSWEAEVAGRVRKWWMSLVGLVVNAPATLLFFAASVGALVEQGHVDHDLRDVGWVCAVMSLVAPILIAGLMALARVRSRTSR
jgi:hypothetical protein